MNHNSAGQVAGAPPTIAHEVPRSGLVLPAAIHPENKRRPPDWRAQCIEFLAKYDPQRQYPWSDPWRKRVWQIRQVQKRLPKNGQKYDHLPFAIIIAEAMASSASPSTRSSSDSPESLGCDLQNLIESFILAGLSPEAIMDRFYHVPRDIISAYIELYFDVGDRLGDQEFILEMVLKCDPIQGLHPSEPYQLWREVGYLAGATCLRNLTDRVSIDNITSATTLDECLNYTGDQILVIQEVIRQRRLPDHDRTVEDLKKLYLRLEAPVGPKSGARPLRPLRSPAVNEVPTTDTSLVSSSRRSNLR